MRVSEDAETRRQMEGGEKAMTHRQFAAMLIVVGFAVFWYPYLLWLGVAMMGFGALLLFLGWLKPPTNVD